MVHHSRRAWMIVCVFTLVMLSIGGGSVIAQDATPAAVPAGTPSADGAFDAMINVGGRGIHVACAGAATDSPTVLFESGGPNPDGGAVVVRDVGSDLAADLGTRFCAYDRAGAGGSGPDPVGVRTFTEAAADLNAVLAIPELGCPCVVIGESLGGGLALVALTEDSSGFGGLVLLDSVYPGVVDDFIGLAPPDSPEATGSQFGSPADSPENIDVEASFRQITVPSSPPGIPVVVIAHGAGDPPGCWPCSPEFPVAAFEAAWQAGQLKLAESLGGALIVAENTRHGIANENPGLVIEQTLAVIAAMMAPAVEASPVASPAA